MTFDAPPDLTRKIVSTPEAVRAALADLAVALGTRGLASDLITNLQIVLAEALNNVVEHAYVEAPDREIDLSIWISADGVWCEIRDDGVSIPGGTMPGGRFPKIDPVHPDSLPEGGFGWPLVHLLTRELSYVRDAQENRLRLLIPHSQPSC